MGTHEVSRFGHVELADMPEDLRDRIGAIAEKSGFVPNVFRALAHRPRELRAFLDYHRATLAMKCEGLSDEQLRQRSSPPSTLTLLGLVRHMAEVERTWFRRVVNAEQVGMVWSDEENDFQRAYDATGSTRAEAFDAWAAEVEISRRVEREAASLDVTAHQARWGEDVSLRLVMVHMIQEYARHNGHADFLREQLDGSTGDFQHR